MRNHIKLLTLEQVQEFKNKFTFEFDGENVIVKCRDYKRETRHPADKAFTINSKIRKLTFWAEAIEIWAHLSYDDSANLVDVQDICSRLALMYQPITVENVKKMLENNL